MAASVLHKVEERRSFAVELEENLEVVAAVAVAIGLQTPSLSLSGIAGGVGSHSNGQFGQTKWETKEKGKEKKTMRKREDFDERTKETEMDRWTAGCSSAEYRSSSSDGRELLPASLHLPVGNPAPS